MTKSINEQLLSGEHIFPREKDIIQWGISRNILGDTAQGTLKGQQDKTRKEYQEWLRDHNKDGLGDIYVTLVMQAGCMGKTLTQVFNEAEKEELTLDNLGNVEDYYADDQRSMIEEWFEYCIGDLGFYLSQESELTTIAYLLDCVALCATQEGWTLEECVEVAWNDIKDRTGLMVHGTFVKQDNLDKLSALGVVFSTKGGEAFFETGEEFDPTTTKQVVDIFLDLGFTYNIGSGYYIKTTGVE